MSLTDAEIENDKKKREMSMRLTEGREGGGINREREGVKEREKGVRG